MLIECLECGNTVSDKAKFCVNCGVKVKKQSTRDYSTIIFLVVTAVILMFVVWMVSEKITVTQEGQAKATVKRYLREAAANEGSSYKSIAWGSVEFNSLHAGTGTKKFFSDEKTGTPPSDYSITHRFSMRNGLGLSMTYDIRVFFTDESCTKWAGYEYMDDNDSHRYLMR